MLPCALLALALLSSCSVGAIQIDDSSNRIQYNSPAAIWLHDSNQNSQPWFNKTLSYSNAENAWFSFNASFTRLAIYVGRKQDRGRFLVQIDDQFAGSGDAFQGGVSTEQPSDKLYEISGLAAAIHVVTCYKDKLADTRIQSGRSFLALDYIEIDEAEPTTTLAYSSSNVYPTQTTKVAAVNDEGVLTARGSGDASKAGIIGGVVGAVGGLLLAALMCAAIWLWFRRRRQHRTFSQRGSIEEVEPEMQDYSVASPFTHQSLLSPATSTAFTDRLTSSIPENHSLLPPGAWASYQVTEVGGVQSIAEDETEEADANQGRSPPAYTAAFNRIQDIQSTSADGLPTETARSPAKGHL